MFYRRCAGICTAFCAFTLNVKTKQMAGFELYEINGIYTRKGCFGAMADVKGYVDTGA